MDRGIMIRTNEDKHKFYTTYVTKLCEKIMIFIFNFFDIDYIIKHSTI